MDRISREAFNRINPTIQNLRDLKNNLFAVKVSTKSGKKDPKQSAKGKKSNDGRKSAKGKTGITGKSKNSKSSGKENAATKSKSSKGKKSYVDVFAAKTPRPTISETRPPTREPTPVRTATLGPSTSFAPSLAPEPCAADPQTRLYGETSDLNITVEFGYELETASRTTDNQINNDILPVVEMTLLNSLLPRVFTECSVPARKRQRLLTIDTVEPPEGQVIVGLSSLPGDRLLNFPCAAPTSERCDLVHGEMIMYTTDAANEPTTAAATTSATGAANETTSAASAMEESTNSTQEEETQFSRRLDAASQTLGIIAETMGNGELNGAHPSVNNAAYVDLISLSAAPSLLPTRLPTPSPIPQPTPVPVAPPPTPFPVFPPTPRPTDVPSQTSPTGPRTQTFAPTRAPSVATNTAASSSDDDFDLFPVLWIPISALVLGLIILVVALFQCWRHNQEREEERRRREMLLNRERQFLVPPPNRAATIPSRGAYNADPRKNHNETYDLSSEEGDFDDEEDEEEAKENEGEMSGNGDAELGVFETFVDQDDPPSGDEVSSDSSETDTPENDFERDSSFRVDQTPTISNNRPVFVGQDPNAIRHPNLSASDNFPRE